MKIFDVFKSIFSTYIFEGMTRLMDGKEIRIAGEKNKGTEVFIVTDETELPMPDGEFTLEDGSMITTKDGKIVEVVEEPETEEVEPIEEPLEAESVIESAQDAPVDTPVETPTDENEPTSDLEQRIKDLEDKLNNFLAKHEAVQAEYEAKIAEFDAQVADFNKTKEEFSSKFERVMVVEPVKQNEILINTNQKKSNSILGSYDEVYKK